MQNMKNLMLITLSALFLVCCGGNEKKEPTAKLAETNATITPNEVIAVGKIEPEKGVVNVSAPKGGIVRTVFKNDGDFLRLGEPIIQLDDDLEQNRINEIRFQIKSQQAQILVEKKQILMDQINLSNKNNLLAKAKRLVLAGAETQKNYDDLGVDVKIYQLNIETAKAKVEFANSKLNEFYALLKTAETEAKMKVFKAPFEGVLLDMKLEKGESINQFSIYAELAPKGNLIVKAQVDEMFSSEVKIGQQVEITYTGSDKVITTGEVIMVAAYLKKKSIFSEKSDDQEDRRIREVRIALKSNDNLIINSKVECKIKL